MWQSSNISKSFVEIKKRTFDVSNCNQSLLRQQMLSFAYFVFFSSQGSKFSFIFYSLYFHLKNTKQKLCYFFFVKFTLFPKTYPLLLLLDFYLPIRNQFINSNIQHFADQLNGALEEIQLNVKCLYLFMLSAYVSLNDSAQLSIGCPWQCFNNWKFVARFFYLLAAITTSITAIWSHQLLVPTQTLNKMTQMFIQRKNKMIRIVATDSVIWFDYIRLKISFYAIAFT